MHGQLTANAVTQQRLGGLHSANLFIRSLDFAVVEALQAKGDWEAAGDLLNRETLTLERGGAELLLLATNTMHKVADHMMRGIKVAPCWRRDCTGDSRSRL